MDQQMAIDRILKARRCGKLFEPNEKKVRETYREYAKTVHPDGCELEMAEEAFIKLNKLYQQALECLRLGTWESVNDGFYYTTDFELGNRHFDYTKGAIWYRIHNRKYMARYREMVNAFKENFPWDLRTRDLYLRKIPDFTTESSINRIIVDVGPDYHPMDLFLKVYGDRLDGRDIAWMISRMCDLCCFLNHGGMVLNGITPENLAINVVSHSIMIPGGWWYAAPAGSPMTGTNKAVYECMSLKAQCDKIAEYRTDMECVRKMFREVIRGKAYIPEPIIEWLNWCGCGRPEDAMLTIAKFLEARSGEWDEREEKMMATYGTNKLWENELLLCLAYTMDAAGFTEHGGSIYSCWTNKDGEYFLWAIREAEKREELDI